MKTCTQILDSGFRGKINVVSPCDSAKRASPGWKGCMAFPIKREVKSSPLTRASPTNTDTILLLYPYTETLHVEFSKRGTSHLKYVLKCILVRCFFVDAVS